MIATPESDLINIKLKLGRLSYNLLMEEYPLAERYISQVDNDHWMLDTAVANLQGVGRFVVGLMDDIEIIDSAELKEFLVNYIKQYFK
jgi:hypothetical protein